MNLPNYTIKNVEQYPSPALLVFPEIIASNVDKMIEIAGSADRLRPHVKTHKTPEILSIQIEKGINKFKCATIREAEMAADSGAKDILIAYPLYGANQLRYFQLIKSYPNATFGLTVDNEILLSELASNAPKLNTTVNVWIDIDLGCGRTGIQPGKEAIDLINQVLSNKCFQLKGIHIYDGNIHDPDYASRKTAVTKYLNTLNSFLDKLPQKITNIVCGGTPTFSILAEISNFDLSPGTPILWDYGYGSNFKDYNFIPAAVLLCRVIHEGDHQLTIDLGYKAIASEMPHPRVYFPEIPGFTVLNHSEEHLVIAPNHSTNLKVGDTLVGIPWHICPTVARYDKLYPVVNGQIKSPWTIAARGR